MNVTVVNPLQDAAVAGAATTTGHALEWHYAGLPPVFFGIINLYFFSQLSIKIQHIVNKFIQLFLL